MVLVDHESAVTQTAREPGAEIDLVNAVEPVIHGTEVDGPVCSDRG
jgi:hypothetical protein